MRALLVAAAGVAAAGGVQLPFWSAAIPQSGLPFGGLPVIPGVQPTLLYFATPELGLYNHAPMLDVYSDPVTGGATILAMWKNGPLTEDQPGQRVMYSQSHDGITWTVPNAQSILFPNVSTNSNPAALFVEPTVHVNGRLYAAASVSQFCLWSQETAALTLARRVFTDSNHAFGPWFWLTSHVPAALVETSVINGILALNETDTTTQGDMAILLDDLNYAPCGSVGGEITNKCEFCAGGCLSDAVIRSYNLTESTHYTVPPSDAHTGLPDVMLIRSMKHTLWASVRNNASGQGGWLPPVQTNIPDAISNLNAGALPDGRRYLLSNAGPYGFRDPLTLALTEDGYNFSSVVAVLSCSQLQGSGCTDRNPKEGGPGVEYPQGIVVTSPAGLAGMWVIFSANKEDIWIARVPLGAWDHATMMVTP